eukprot:scaffold21956_cov20-Tisochrysis_lutea.AAC.2
MDLCVGGGGRNSGVWEGMHGPGKKCSDWTESEPIGAPSSFSSCSCMTVSMRSHEHAVCMSADGCAFQGGKGIATKWSLKSWLMSKVLDFLVYDL